MANIVKVWLSRIIRSRTIRFNAIMAAMIALEGSFALLQPFIPGNVFAYASIVLTMGNTYYRVVTTEPLKNK